MNVISKKLLMLSVALAALGVGSVLATGKKDPIVGSWNVILHFVQKSQGQTEVQILDEAQSLDDQNLDEPEGLDEFQVMPGKLIPAVIKFSADCTLVADGLVPPMSNISLTPDGTTDTSIAVGTWKRIGKCLYVIELSTVVSSQGSKPPVENVVTKSFRLKTKAIIRLVKRGRFARIFNVESRAFGLKDICCKKPFKHLFPRLSGVLCRLCKPKRETKKHDTREEGYMPLFF